MPLKRVLTIRRAKREDCPSIARVHTCAVMAIPAGYYTPEEIASWAIPREVESYEHSIDDKEFYVAAEDELIVGFGVLNRESQVIEAIYVTPEAKGLGVGLKLLQKLEERGRDLGLKALHLNASLNAVGFYKRAGFVAQAEAKYRLPTGIEIRCVPMVKELMPEADAI
jgi:putative acetyltransferase